MKGPAPSATPARLVLGFIALLVIGFLGWLVYRDNLSALALVERGVETNGVVIGKSCSDHGLINYEFHASGRSYLGHGTCGYIACDAVKIGEVVPVTYESIRPQNSTCLSPTSERQRALSGYSVVIILGLIIGFGIWRITRVGA